MTEEKKRKQNEAGGENLPEKEEDFEIDPQEIGRASCRERV